MNVSTFALENKVENLFAGLELCYYLISVSLKVFICFVILLKYIKRKKINLIWAYYQQGENYLTKRMLNRNIAGFKSKGILNNRWINCGKNDNFMTDVLCQNSRIEKKGILCQP